MPNKENWFVPSLPENIPNIPVSFVVPPKLNPESVLSILSTEKYVTQNQAQKYTFNYGITGLTIVSATATLNYVGNNVGGVLSGAYSFGSGALPISEGKVTFEWLNSPISLKQITKTKSENFYPEISGGIVWRYHVISDKEPEYSWLIKAGLQPGDEVFLGYTVPEIYYNSTDPTNQNELNTSRLITVTETAFPTTPTSISYSKELQFLQSISVDGEVMNVNIKNDESSALIKKIDPKARVIHFNKSFVPDNEITLTYKTLSDTYTYKGFKFVDESNVISWHTCDLNPAAGHQISDQVNDIVLNSYDALKEQVILYLIPSCVCKINFSTSGPAESTIINGSLTFDSALNYGETHFVRHYVGQTNEVFDTSLGFDENFYNYWGITPFGQAEFDEPGSGVLVDDIFSSFLPSMIPIGKVLLAGVGSEESVKVLDLRPRGGGLPLNFNEKDASSRGNLHRLPDLWDLGNWPGKVVFEGGSVKIQVPSSVLDTLTKEQVEDTAKFYVPPGVMFEVEYID